MNDSRTLSRGVTLLNEYEAKLARPAGNTKEVEENLAEARAERAALKRYILDLESALKAVPERELR